jgi:hypothetical protein
MTTKLRIIPAPITISNTFISAGDQTIHIPVSPIGQSAANNISLTINGAMYPLTDYGSHNYHNPSYCFFYDGLQEYRAVYGDLYIVDGVNLETIKIFNFWGNDDFLKWFEDNCTNEVFIQNYGSQLWRFIFRTVEEHDAFKAKISKQRNHSFKIEVPADVKVDYFVKEVSDWCMANLQDKFFVRGHDWFTHNNAHITVEVKDEAEAVMTKIVWVDGNKEKALP